MYQLLLYFVDDIAIILHSKNKTLYVKSRCFNVFIDGETNIQVYYIVLVLARDTILYFSLRYRRKYA